MTHPSDFWTSTTTPGQLHLKRGYRFGSESEAEAFVSRVGHFMSSPNINVFVEKTPHKPEVAARIDSARDEFLLENVQIFSLELDYLYDQQVAAGEAIVA